MLADIVFKIRYEISGSDRKILRGALCRCFDNNMVKAEYGGKIFLLNWDIIAYIEVKEKDVQ